MPSAAAMDRSSGVVTNPRTRLASAPTYTVRTAIVALSMRGYWRTLMLRTARIPVISMTRLTTTASTGRRTKRSVNRTCTSSVRRIGRKLGSYLDVVVHDDARPISELESPSSDDLVPRPDAVHDSDEIAPCLAESD